MALQICGKLASVSGSTAGIGFAIATDAALRVDGSVVKAAA